MLVRTVDSSIAEVLVAAEQWRELAMPTTADNSIAVVPEPVEHRPGLVARTPGLEPHIHTDTGGNSREEDSNTGGSSREEDKPGQLPLRCQWEDRCRFSPVPGPKTKTMRRWPGQHRRSKQFSSSWQILLKWRSSHSPRSAKELDRTAVWKAGECQSLQFSLSASPADRHNAHRSS